MNSSKFSFSLGNYRCFPHDSPANFTIGDGITAFVGSNNSGKTALLRFFYDFREAFERLVARPQPASNRGDLPVAETVRDREELLHNRNSFDMSISVEFPPNHSVEVKRATQLVEATVHRPGTSMVVHRVNGFRAADIEAAQGRNDIVYRQSDDVAMIDLGTILQSTRELKRNCYIPAFRNALNLGGARSYDILVGNAFVTDWIAAKDGETLAKRRTASKVEEDVCRLMGFKKFQARKAAASPSLLIQIDDSDYPMEDVGSGVAQLLMLLGTVALKKPSFLFIDEPELNLHPSLQLDLVTALASYVNGNLVFATHNLGLARAAATRIYTVQRDANGCSSVRPLEDNPTLAQVLGELQFGAYSQVGGNRVLLVEGPDDVLVFQQFLRKFGEDHNVVLLPLGGRSLINGGSTTQLAEIGRICPNIAAIIDSEKPSEGSPIEASRIDFKTNCESLQFRCHLTERRATEHYFTQRSLTAAFGEGAVALDPYAPIKLSGGWYKGRNWLAAKEMTREELDRTDIGQFLKNWLASPIKSK